MTLRRFPAAFFVLRCRRFQALRHACRLRFGPDWTSPLRPLRIPKPGLALVEPCAPLSRNRLLKNSVQRASLRLIGSFTEERQRTDRGLAAAGCPSETPSRLSETGFQQPDKLSALVFLSACPRSGIGHIWLLKNPLDRQNGGSESKPPLRSSGLCVTLILGQAAVRAQAGTLNRVFQPPDMPPWPRQGSPERETALLPWFHPGPWLPERQETGRRSFRHHELPAPQARER